MTLSKEKKTEELKNDEQLVLLAGHIKELEEKLLRNQAEVQNYKRRKDEEVERMLKYKAEDIFIDFLPIMDNFERAMNMDDDNLDDEVSKFLKGFKMIYNATASMLEKYEVKEIVCLNEKFDPTYHQAVVTEACKEIEPGIIVEVFQKGYMYKDRVIRPSMVKVSAEMIKEKENDKNE